MEKPFSQACENNKTPILEQLLPALQDSRSVLEIGSGTGQHAVHFAAAMPHLQWQCCDQRPYLDGIRQWIADSHLSNLLPPQEFEVNHSPWPSGEFDTVYSANTLHIMSWPSVERLFARLAEQPGITRLCIYGPFNYHGDFTSDSNASFDRWLKDRDPLSGIRDMEAVNALAAEAGYTLHRDYAMPANNRLVIWLR
ncbi:MAG: DUF938 domain-containing protein [Spongiibacter sp.]|uniref:DUF938 domain-containing protein n=1 Tax=Spongiibacter thalassae TaxID=2721624 RepID=A0ABX1GG88_9GAMM|nr:DUF938 domain-containing protein [Spongiibacter thalassae]NKI18227.1 DUF938 domain-containing protein [Spongiibacter thalassae]